MSATETIQSLERACEMLNSRLRSCFSLSSVGFYENAIEGAEAPPQLLSECTRIVAQLGICRAKGTSEFIESLDKSAARIDEALVSALQETYEKASLLKPLAQNLRKLVLARAPLPARLGVMRQMLAIDPSHPFLDQDIRACERAWFKQSIDYCNGLANESKTDKILEVVADLRGSNYSEPIPQIVGSSIKAALRSSRLNRLGPLEGELHADFEAQNFGKLQALLTELDQLQADAEYINPELEKRIGSIRRWVKDEEARLKLLQDKVDAKAELSKLQQDPRTSTADLQAALVRAKALGVSDEVDEVQVSASIENRKNRRNRIAFIAVLATAIVMVMIPTSYWIISKNVQYERDVVAVIGKVNYGPRRLQKFAEARDILNRLDSNVSGDERVVLLRKELEDDDRLFTQVRAAIESLKGGTPLVMQEGAIRDIEKEVNDKLAQLKKRVLPDGKNLFDLDALKFDLQRSVEDRQQQNAKFLSSRELTVANAIDSLVSRCKLIGEDLRAGGLKEGVDSQVAELSKDLAKMKEEIAQSGVPCRVFDEKLPEVNAAMEEVKLMLPIVEKLSRLRDEAASSRLTSDKLEEWYEVRESLATRSDAQVSEEAKRLANAVIDFIEDWLDAESLEELKKVTGSTGDFPLVLRNEIQTASQLLMKSQKRDLWADEFVANLESRNIPNSWVCRTLGADEENQNHSYFVSKKKPNGGEMLAVVGESTQSAFPNIPDSEARLSPQAEFYSFVKEETDRKPHADFYESSIRVYERLRTGTKESRMDPILRASLIGNVLELMAERSEGFKAMFMESPFVALQDARNGFKKLEEKERWAISQAYAEASYKNARTTSLNVLQMLPEIAADGVQTAKEYDQRVNSHARKPICLAGMFVGSADSDDVVFYGNVRAADLESLFVLAADSSKQLVPLKQISKQSVPKFNMMPIIGIYKKPKLE